jgi:hypothetical protein
MNHQDLEYELTRALRRKEPSRDLTPGRRVSNWRLWAAAGLAAAVAGPAGLAQYRAYHEKSAKNQLVLALHLAARKLDMAQNKLRTVK